MFDADTSGNIPSPNTGPVAGTTYRGLDPIGTTQYSSAEIAMDWLYNGNTDFGEWLALHEIGHALGLTGDGSLSSSYTTDMTVMSYQAGNGISATANGARLAITPMALDIKAIEEKYDGSTELATGNNSYVYSSSGSAFNGSNRSQTIMDTGGIDQLDLSQYTGNLLIDLRSAVDANGNWLGYKTVIGSEYVFLAHNTVIENAIGGEPSNHTS